MSSSKLQAQLSVIGCQTSTHLQWLVYPAAPPTTHQPTQWEDSLYGSRVHCNSSLSAPASEAGAERAYCVKDARTGRDAAFCSQYARLVLTVPSAGTCQVLRYTSSCSPTDVWLWSRLRQNISNCQNVRNVFAVHITLSAACGCIFREMEWE